jgi:hypothetical protein
MGAVGAMGAMGAMGAGVRADRDQPYQRSGTFT